MRKCFRGSNELADGMSRLDFRKKEKKAMTHVAQNVASNELVRSSFPWSLCKMSGVIESLSAVFSQLGIKLLFLSMDCTCKGNASKALRDRCGVTYGRAFEGQEISFFTRISQCTESWIREIASAKVLAAVGI